MIEITSNFITAKIDPFGARVVKLRDLENRTNFIKKPGTADRPHDEFFFPIIGHLIDGTYHLGSKAYKIPDNGLFFGREFEILEREKDRVRLRSGHNEDTLKAFPFKFSITVEFKVYGPKLMMSYEIKNLNRSEMYFSFGIFPTFNLPIISGDKDEYFLEFEKHEPRGGYSLTRGLSNFDLPDDKTFFNGRHVTLTPQNFHRDLIIINDPVSTHLTFRNTTDSCSMVFDFGNIPYLAIEANYEKEWLRIGPWFGIADSVHSNQDFFKKEGLVALDRERSFHKEFSLHLY